MSFKLVIALISIFFLSVLIFFYFTPIKTINFGANLSDSNFSSFAKIDEGMQFYSNMRFPESKISYKISDCPLQKENDMQFAFELMEDSTLLTFYPVDDNPEISVTCSEGEKPTGSLFIAGEGGPTNITAVGDFSVILNGEILLIRESKCVKPNVAIHELLHVLGFKHSENPKNIMYNITDCDQIIGEDTLQVINDLYSVPSYPDLSFENVTAALSGRFLDVDFAVINEGLKNSEEFNIKIYADGSLVKEIEMEPINIGYGRFISMKNIIISQINVQEVEFFIESEFDEINKENNKIKLAVKNN